MKKSEKLKETVAGGFLFLLNFFRKAIFYSFLLGLIGGVIVGALITKRIYDLKLDEKDRKIEIYEREVISYKDSLNKYKLLSKKYQENLNLTKIELEKSIDSLSECQKVSETQKVDIIRLRFSLAKCDSLSKVKDRIISDSKTQLDTCKKKNKAQAKFTTEVLTENNVIKVENKNLKESLLAFLCIGFLFGAIPTLVFYRKQVIKSFSALWLLFKTSRLIVRIASYLF